MKKYLSLSNRFILIVIIIAIIIAAGTGLTSCREKSPAGMESITIAGFPYFASTLVYIAEEQGFFAGNGLNVTLKPYSSSAHSINGLLSNEADFSVSSEFNIVANAFTDKNISVIGTIDNYQSMYIIGRKDKGIEKKADLKGKRIGLARGEKGEFYLGRFLDLNGMSIRDVTLVDMPPSQWVAAITDGSIDALISGIFIDQIQERLGDNGIVLWPAQSSQPGYWVISGRNDWLTGHRKQINNLLKSINQAEEYISNHPAESKAILKRKMDYTDAYISTIWPQNHFSLSLDQTLITVMKDEARWMISNNLTSEKTIPDFVSYIYIDGLKAVKPAAVNIIR